MRVCVLSGFNQVQLFVTLWNVACQVPLSIGFSRQEYWSGLLCPPPGDLPHPGIKPKSPACRWILTTVPLVKPFSTILLCINKQASD